MKNKTLIALLLACSPTLAFAHNLTVGSPVPAVGVEKHGEIVLQDNNINYQKWRSADLLGKVRVIQAIADVAAQRDECATDGRDHRREIPSRELPNHHHHQSRRCHLGHQLFCEIVRARQQKEFPWSSMVLDEFGLVAQAWQLQAESSAIIVQDKQGNVLFVKEGRSTKRTFKPYWA